MLKMEFAKALKSKWCPQAEKVYYRNEILWCNFFCFNQALCKNSLPQFFGKNKYSPRDT